MDRRSLKGNGTNFATQGARGASFKDERAAFEKEVDDLQRRVGGGGTVQRKKPVPVLHPKSFGPTVDEELDHFHRCASGCPMQG